MKSQILEAIGETELNRSAQIHAALEANERIKYYLSLLQLAVARADHPEQPPESLRGERLACGIDDRALDELVTRSRREDGRYRLPGYAAIAEQIVHDLRAMAAPVLAKTDGSAAKLAQRMERLLAAFPKAPEDLIEGSAIEDLASAGRGEEDTLHRLVMDLHKALNAMQAEITEEQLDGASVYQIEDADRPLIAAFMAGLNRTAPLKFNHPGLGTTATRFGDELIIQNDLGTTDAHVIVLRIEGLRAQLTHTDIHPERIEFLREMLKRYDVSWGEEQSQLAVSQLSGVPFQLITARFEAEDSMELLDYLTFLGSRLVFLIDWNRARKELRGFLRAKDRFAVLAWAAEAEVGHRGFLELGGAQLINRAIEDTRDSAMHFGDRLCDVVGDAEAAEFIRFTFRAAMEGLRDHQSPGLIQDRVRAELQAHFSTEGKRLFQYAGEQAAMIYEIAALLHEGVHSVESGVHNGRYKKLARRARVFEHSADQLVTSSREAIRRRPEYTTLFRLLETADNAADELEEAAFLMDLLVASEPGGEVLAELGALADLLLEASQEWVKALSHASRADRPGGLSAQEDVRDFLTAVDALFVLEHRADDAERALTYAAVQKARDFRQLHIYSKMADSMEEASDALKWAGLMARDYLLGNVLRT
jgi:uncharacterized protein Yka (UPF0111/DUF47 family)